MRATVLTVLSALGLGFSFALTLPFVALSPMLQEADTWLRDLNRFQQGMSPLLSLARHLPFYEGMNVGHWAKEAWELPVALLGLACWALGGFVLWLLLLRRFRQLAGRQPVRATEPPPVAEVQAREPVAV
jgi:hypothetical protein